MNLLLAHRYASDALLGSAMAAPDRIIRLTTKLTIVTLRHIHALDIRIKKNICLILQEE